MSYHYDKIRNFNKMYGLPVSPLPTLLFKTREDMVARLKRFKEIMLEEIDEVDDIITTVSTPNNLSDDTFIVLTALADWLTDIQVYAASEMLKFGLHPETIMDIVMASNSSKLGPNYWKPEPKIEEFLRQHARSGVRPPLISPQAEDKVPVKEFGLLLVDEVAQLRREASLAALKQFADQESPKRDAEAMKQSTAKGVHYEQAMVANSHQVGGNHYNTGGKPQHWDLAIMYKWDYLQGQVIKYVMRWKDKYATPDKQLEDLKKARHNIDKYIENYAQFLPAQPTSTVEGMAQGGTLLKAPMQAGVAPASGRILEVSELFLDADQRGNSFWQNEGYFGNGECLYSCRKCKHLNRRTTPLPVPHDCSVK